MSLAGHPFRLNNLIKKPLSMRFALLCIIALAAIPPLIFSGISLQRYAMSERLRAQFQLEESAKGVARAIDAEFGATEAVLLSLSASTRLANNDLEGFERQLRSVAAKTGRLFDLVDENGQALINLSGAPAFLLMSAARLADDRNIAVTDVLKNPDGEPTARVIIALQRDGGARWTLQGVVKSSEFRRILAEPGVPGDWIVSLVDGNGTHFIRSHFNERFAGKPLVTPLVAHLKQQKRGTLQTTSLEGIPLISTVAYAPRSGWAAAVGLPQSTLNAPFQEQLSQLLTLAAVVIGLALVGGLLVAGYLSQSMDRLKDMAARVTAAELVEFQPTMLRDTNELGHVLETTCAELHRRSQELSQLNATLEDQVISRTGELTESNLRLQEEIARREQSEAQLRQAQKMEAVGQLTGGIAHDFNNMLAIILNSLHLLRRRLGNDDAHIDRYVDSAIIGADRAVNLVRRLLEFSRQHPLAPVSIDANKLITGMEEVLRRTIPESISIELVLADGLWQSYADVHGLENVIINLAVNARDAMSLKGKLIIETANAYLDEDYAAAHSEVTAGQYVMVAVTDNGEGMSPDVLSRAYEPFFTTKPIGEGTGLGLSQVYGFIKQSGGHVKIYSEIGQGTTVKLYLPRHSQQPQKAETHPAAAKADLQNVGDKELILVVEDDPDVRSLTVDMLRELNYETIVAENGVTALALIDKHPDITLLFTDVVMPAMNGRELADEALKKLSQLKVLFTTGYTRDAIVHNGVLDEGVQLISKPFTIERLASKLKEVLALGR